MYLWGNENFLFLDFKWLVPGDSIKWSTNPALKRKFGRTEVKYLKFLIKLLKYEGDVDSFVPISIMVVIGLELIIFNFSRVSLVPFLRDEKTTHLLFNLNVKIIWHQPNIFHFKFVGLIAFLRSLKILAQVSVKIIMSSTTNEPT